MAWNPFGVLLEISASAGTVTRTSATQFKVVINAAWETYYSGAQTNYGMAVSTSNASMTLNPFGTKSSGSSGAFTGTYSISGNAAATKTIAVTFRNFNNDNGDSATKTINLNVNVPAWTSYTVSYNANGGSGAPSSQTKWKDQTLTLSSAKPTRTGYTFKGWATSSGGGVAYAAGASYTANAAVTLWAVWQANTYTVSYNANGGSGAPSSQTKTHGVALSLSTTIPTRTNYTFKGWGTSASATSIAYPPGANYTVNAAVTLYAIWELAYTKPRITNFFVKRCDANGTVKEDGTCALVSFDWASDKAISQILIEWKAANAEAYTSSFAVAVTGTSGTVSQMIGSVAADENNIIGTWRFNETLNTVPGFMTQDFKEVICSGHCIYNGIPTDFTYLYFFGTPDAIEEFGMGNDDAEFAVYFEGWESVFQNREITINDDPDDATFLALVKANAHKPVSGSFDITSSYAIRVTIDDGVEITAAARTLNSLSFTLHGKAGGDGIAFGKTSELGAAESLGGSGVADFAFDAKFNQPVYGNVLGLNRLPAIPINSDLNNYLETGCWAIYSNAIAETITCGYVLLGTNDTVPPARAGRFEVYSSTGEGIRPEQWSYLRQRFIPYNDDNPIYERDVVRGESNAWTFSNWWKSSLTPSAAAKVYNKGVITLVRTANITLGTVNAYTKIPLTSQIVNTNSNRIKLLNNTVRVGADVGYVKVSGQVLVKCGTVSGNRHVRIQKVSGGTTTNCAWNCLTLDANANGVFSFAPIIIPVKTSDQIMMVFYTSDSTDSIQSGNSTNGYQSYLTVEEL